MVPAPMPPECHVNVASINGNGKEGPAAREKHQAGKRSPGSAKREELVWAGGCRMGRGNRWKSGWFEKKEPKSLSEGICLGKVRWKHRARRGKARKRQENKSREGDGGDTRRESGCRTG